MVATVSLTFLPIGHETCEAECMLVPDDGSLVRAKSGCYFSVAKGNLATCGQAGPRRSPDDESLHIRHQPPGLQQVAGARYSWSS